VAIHIKRVTKPPLHFKSFHSADSVTAAIELMHMIRKGQFVMGDAVMMPFADQFYALAGQLRPV
jgi:transposase-like protein